MWWLSACTCLGAAEPTPDPARWAEVETLAATCPAVPDSLTEKSAVELRKALVEWHTSEPGARVQMPARALLDALVGPTTTAAERAAGGHAVAALEQCGALVEVMTAQAIGQALCRDPAYAGAYAALGGPPELRSIAAREAVSAWTLVEPMRSEKTYGARRQTADLGAELQAWVLDSGPDAWPPKPPEDESRVLARLMLTGIDSVWDDLLADRQALAACLDLPPADTGGL